VAFTPAVKRVQLERGSRGAYARLEAQGGFEQTLTDDLAAFIARQQSFFLATATADGQPYVQHRGGPPGFLRVLDERTLGFADFRGNRQYLSLGNLSENPRAHLFLVDWAQRQRIKVWGTAVVSHDAGVLDRLTVPGYRAKVEQAIVITVTAWDANCPQHLPQLVPLEEVAKVLALRDERIAELEEKLGLG
jgi:hypothetical protein